MSDPTPPPSNEPPSPVGPPPPAAPPPDPYGLGPTSLNIAAHIAAALCYLPPFITGLLFFLLEKQNRFVRFHAMQGLLLGLTLLAVDFVFQILAGPAIWTVGGFILTLLWLVNMAWLALAIFCIVQAATGKWFKLPVIGDIALKQAGPE